MSRLESTTPVHERSGANHNGIHGEARGQVCNTCVEVAGARNGGQEEEEANAAVKGENNGLIEDSLADCAHQSQTITDEVELGNL